MLRILKESNNFGILGGSGKGMIALPWIPRKTLSVQWWEGLD